MNTNPLSAYKQTRVKTASQGQLIVMLYDEGIRQLKTAENQLGASHPKLDLVHNAIVKAQDIITELTVSLDFEKGGDIAQNLFSLYLYFNQRLIDANLAKDPAALGEVRQLMSELREAWAGVENTSYRENIPGGVNLAG